MGGGWRGRKAQLGHFDHRKFFVVDGRVGWVGGGGIEDHFEDGRFHDLFLRLTGPVVSQLQLVFLASFRWLGGDGPRGELDALFPAHDDGAGRVPATVLHNAPGPITGRSRHAIARLLDGARETLDVVNPYVTDAAMIRRIARAARRGVRVRLFVPAKANNRACAAAQLSHHEGLLDAGVRILGHPTMLHAKAFVRDGEDVLVGTCNLDGWSLKRFFEIDVLVRSPQLAAQFDERFSVPAEAVVRRAGGHGCPRARRGRGLRRDLTPPVARGTPRAGGSARRRLSRGARTRGATPRPAVGVAVRTCPSEWGRRSLASAAEQPPLRARDRDAPGRPWRPTRPPG